MLDEVTSEQLLTHFLETIRQNELRTWQRQRTSAELRSFIDRRQQLVDDLV
ncbi:MAG: hypothetical protein Q4A34_01230 [Candidatus Saccharibacteria bacterium]|nr:hypothetical protein [Candidatus Saccharibacteria bacterium]